MIDCTKMGIRMPPGLIRPFWPHRVHRQRPRQLATVWTTSNYTGPALQAALDVFPVQRLSRPLAS